jgi:hypothetical protein
MAFRVFAGMLIGGTSGFVYGLWRCSGPSRLGKQDNYGAAFVEIVIGGGEALLITGFYTLVRGVAGAAAGLVLSTSQ